MPGLQTSTLFHHPLECIESLGACNQKQKGCLLAISMFVQCAGWIITILYVFCHNEIRAQYVAVWMEIITFFCIREIVQR